jgi:hypothetical protein
MNVRLAIRLLYRVPNDCTARRSRRIRMGIALTVCHLDLVPHPSVALRARPAPCLTSQSSLPVLVPFSRLRMAVVWGDIAACRHDDFKARGPSVQSLGIGVQGCPMQPRAFVTCIANVTSEIKL